jgi:sulfur-oxidizing protein SoxX
MDCRASLAMTFYFIILLNPAFSQDTINEPIQGLKGDFARGEALMQNQRTSLCLLCHDKGTLAPSLQGVGTRLTEGQIRLRIIDQRRINMNSIMPPFYALENIVNVSEKYKGKTILDAQQVEDLVIYLTGAK